MLSNFFAHQSEPSFCLKRHFALKIELDIFRKRFIDVVIVLEFSLLLFEVINVHVLSGFEYVLLLHIPYLQVYNQVVNALALTF